MMLSKLFRNRYWVYLRYVIFLFLLLGLSVLNFDDDKTLKELSKIECQRYNIENQLSYPIVLHIGDNQTAGARHDVTLVTHVSTERLYMLRSLVQHWPGPLVAAVYGNVTELRNSAYLLQHMVRPGVSFKLVAKRGVLYPINYLRNVALQHSSTRYVFMLDVDFVPSPNLYEDFHNFLQQSLISQIDGRFVAIAPAFATLKSDTQIPMNKKELLEQWNKRETLPYSDAIAFKGGHNSTNYTFWRSTEKHFELPIKSLHNRFEPYLIIERDISPVYNTTFIQRFFDKSSYMEVLKHSGFHFMVLPNAFVIHRPHATETKLQKQKILSCAKAARAKYLAWLQRQETMFYLPKR